MEEWHLETRRLGRRVLVYDLVDSTNTLAAELAEESANDGVVVLADAQRVGRGQHGRSWLCPPGSGVLLSVLLFPPGPLRRPVILAAWVAVAVCETIRQTTNQNAQIKWPNDVLLQGRKVCGILIEQAKGTVAGIGLNVTQSAQSLADAGLTTAGSLAMFTDRTLDCRNIARLLIHQLDEEYHRLCEGAWTTLETRWRDRTGLVDREVVVECHEATHRGRLREMSFDSVAVETAGGEVVRVTPERVKHVHRA